MRRALSPLRLLFGAVVTVSPITALFASATPAAEAAVLSSCTVKLDLVTFQPNAPNGCGLASPADAAPVRVHITSTDATGVISVWICQRPSAFSKPCIEVERQAFLKGTSTPPVLDLSSQFWPFKPDWVFVGSFDGGFTSGCYPEGGELCALYVPGQLNTVNGSFTGSLVTADD